MELNLRSKKMGFELFIVDCLCIYIYFFLFLFLLTVRQLNLESMLGKYFTKQTPKNTQLFYPCGIIGVFFFFRKQGLAFRVSCNIALHFMCSLTHTSSSTNIHKRG